MKNSYVYQIKHKYVKKPELLEQFGFFRYQADEDVEVFYACPTFLSLDAKPVQHTIKMLERIYKDMSEEERKTEFESNIVFEDGKISTEKSDLKEIRNAQLVFSTNGFAKNILFLNAADHTEYYDEKVLNEACEKIIICLLANDVIYKKKAPKELVCEKVYTKTPTA